MEWASARTTSRPLARCARVHRRAKDNGSIFGDKILFRDALNVFAFYGEETVEDGVDEFRFVVEEREAGKEMHQAIAGHVTAPSAFESGVIVGAPFDLEVLELVLGDAVLLDFADDGVEGIERSCVRIFRLVQNAGGHLRGAVEAENVVNAAIGFNRDLLFEDEFAMDASRASAVQRLIEQRHGVPIEGAAGG